MLVGNIWLFNVIVVLFAAAVSSKQVSGFGGNRLAHGGPELEQKLPNHSVSIPAYQATPKQTAVIGPSTQTDLTGVWANRLDNKRYSKTPRRMKLNFHILSQERPHDVSKKMLKLQPITKMLINNPKNKDIILKMKDTKFIKLMSTGNLLPSDYTYFEQKDTVYFAGIKDIYNSAALNMYSKPGFSEFYQKQAKKYGELCENSREKLHIGDIKSVEMEKAFPEYLDFLTKVKDNNPEYLPIAMLACSVSWKNVVDLTINDVKKENNVYYKEWFLNNQPTPFQPSSTEIFVDKHYTQLKHNERAIIIFCQALMRELNNFLEAGGENLIPLKIIDTICGFIKFYYTV